MCTLLFQFGNLPQRDIARVLTMASLLDGFLVCIAHPFNKIQSFFLCPRSEAHQVLKFRYKWISIDLTLSKDIIQSFSLLINLFIFAGHMSKHPQYF